FAGGLFCARCGFGIHATVTRACTATGRRRGCAVFAYGGGRLRVEPSSDAAEKDEGSSARYKSVNPHLRPLPVECTSMDPRCGRSATVEKFSTTFQHGLDAGGALKGAPLSPR